MTMETTRYDAHHATFTLPAQLRDRTMHMFVLKDDGPNEFSVVVSYADTQGEEDLAEFGDRLIKEMSRALPKFLLRGMQERRLDGCPAIELTYSWRNNGIFMHQRQVVVLVQGATPGSKQAMLMAGTCPNAFSEEWQEAFDNILASVKLRRPLDAQAQLPNPQKPELTYVFALSERRRLLHAFPDAESACRRTDAREVERSTWEFFDALGQPLQPRFTTPNAEWLYGQPGSYVLEPVRGSELPPLGARLHLATALEPHEGIPLADLAAVRMLLESA